MGACLHWDLLEAGPRFPDGVGRIVTALAEASYALPSVYHLDERRHGGGLHQSLERCPGSIRFHRLPERPRQRMLSPVLAQDDLTGLLLAPCNQHKPAPQLRRLLMVLDLIPYEDRRYRRFRPLPLPKLLQQLNASHRLLTISEHVANRLRLHAPRSPAAEVLSLGLFPEPEPQAPAWAPDGPFHLFIGGAEPRKRLALAARMAAAMGDAPLLVIGGNWGRLRPVRFVARAARRVGLVHRSQCTDAELAWCYRHCRSLLYTSGNEGFGLPALEALRARKPVVAEPVTSLPQVLGDFAVWFDAKRWNGEDLRHRIAAWQADDDAIDRWLSHFDWEQTRRHLARIIDEEAAACA